MDNYITTSSNNNLKTIKSIKKQNPQLINNFVNKIGLSQFVNNKTTKQTINKIEKLYAETIVQKPEIIEFDPLNLNSVLADILTIDGIDNPKSVVYKEFIKLNKQAIYNFTINDLKFSINLFYDQNYKDISKTIETIVKRSMVLLKYGQDSKRFANLKTALTSDSFNIYILLYPLNRATYKTVKNYRDINKELKDLQVNGCYNCSSGYTSFMVYKDQTKKFANMLITRLPEVQGLLTHEIGHLLGWDFEVFTETDTLYSTTGMLQTNKLTDTHNKLLQKLPLKQTKCVFAEVFNNTNTTILHSICNAIELNSGTRSWDSNLELFQELLEIEILYSIYHTVKILYWAGFTTYDRFFDTDFDIKYHQKSLLLEYTIIRSFVLLNLNDYVKNIQLTPDQAYSFTITTDDKLTDNYTVTRNKMITEILVLMTGKSEVKQSYKSIFNLFNSHLKDVPESDNNCESKCGNINMEYFCIDLLPKIESETGLLEGGGINYFQKYQKYKQKYLLLLENNKNII